MSARGGGTGAGRGRPLHPTEGPMLAPEQVRLTAAGRERVEALRVRWGLRTRAEAMRAAVDRAWAEGESADTTTQEQP